MIKKNNRRVIVVAAIAFFAVIAVAVLWPFGPHAPNAIPDITLADQDQEPFLRQLQLGWRYERHRDWENAQGAYAEAALAGQETIAVQARNGLQRVLIHQQGCWPRVQQAVRDLTTLWVTLFLILILWLFFTRPVNKPGYSLHPFEDYTEKKIGAGLHSLIHFCIQEAHHTHGLGRTQLLGFATSEFPLFATLSEMNDEFSDMLSSLEALSIGVSKFHLAN